MKTEQLALALDPCEMTEQIMDNLEKRHLIVRLAPSRHVLSAKKEETMVKSLYECDSHYGPHKLITVTVNRTHFDAFGTHPDNEDFILLGDSLSGPLYLVISILKRHQLDSKVSKRTLSRNDFVALTIRFNDPLVSFFTMLKDVPHGEALAEGSRRPSTFYVSESRDLPLDRSDFGPYKLSISRA